MDRRSAHKNYVLPGIYHITMKAADVLRSPFGKVVGNINKPDGDPDAPRVALSPVGQMVEQELLHSIAAHYPMMQVQDYVIMPEHLHFIIEAHSTIMSRNSKAMPLGQVIAGFKKGCNRRYWELTHQGEPAGLMQQGEPAATNRSSADASASGVGAVAVSPQGSTFKVPSSATTGRTSLFAYGFSDVMPLHRGQLDQQRRYIQQNPRSRLMRSSNPAWLRAQRGGIDTALTRTALMGYLQRECPPSLCSSEVLASIESRLLWADGKVACDTYGDRSILSRRLLPVICHRKDVARFTDQKARCLEEAAHDAILVSPRIAKGEQEIIDEAVNHGFPVVIIPDNGFADRFHPSEKRLNLCAEGRLLLITPWQYQYRPNKETVSVSFCKTMNCITQALCRLKDSWWQTHEKVSKLKS